MTSPTQALSQYIIPAKYARVVERTGDLETYEGVVARSEAMHLRRFPNQASLIRSAFNEVYLKKVLPSMRSMQFGGPAIEAKNSRIYNCASSAIDRPRVFAETLWLLLCGTGVGFSVQRCHVDQLPALAAEPVGEHVHQVADTIEGWADALDDLITSAIRGETVVFDYSLVRPKGALLKTSGGRAPGPDGLASALAHIDIVLWRARGRKLQPIECHDILCLAADAVLSGGVRRSALISLFDYDDADMVKAKTGNWHDTHPWRANANNSAVLLRDKTTRAEFDHIYNFIKEWGEPGFVLSDHPDHLTNPCVEAGLYPYLIVTTSDATWLANKGIRAEVGEKLPGWQMCNLTEVNVAACETPEDFYTACRAASTIGTFQADYTDMSYLGAVTQRILERDALIGVGLTGILDNPAIGLNGYVLSKGAAIVVDTNKRIAKEIGINPSPRTTLVKPGGTGSLALGVSSGAGAHHAARYIRRVVANPLEDTFRSFHEFNPGWCVLKTNGDYVIEFPVQAPDNAILLEDLSAVGFLQNVLDIQRMWVQPGQQPDGPSHNVSNTIVVKPDEWDNLADEIWKNRADIRGISLLPHVADKQYKLAPREAITTPQDEERWDFLLSNYKPVIFTASTTPFLSGLLEPACAGGACSLV